MRSIKKISAIVGSTLLVGGVVAAISVTTTSCTPKLTHIKFSDCIQKGGVSGESDSKSIDVNFKGYEGADLLANDFTITDKLDASKTITPTSAEYISVGRYTLELPKTPTWDNAENVFISINKDSFVTDTLGATTLYTNPSWTHINFGACTANGDDGTDNTTSINVRFTGYSGNVLLSSGVFTITDDTDSSKTISATAAYVGPGQYTLSITETSDWNNGDKIFIRLNGTGFQTDTPGMVKNIWKNTRTTITFGTCAADGDDGIDNTTIINVPITAGYTGNDLLVSNFTITYTTNSRRTITPTSAFYDTTTSIYKLTLPETPTWNNNDSVYISVNKTSSNGTSYYGTTTTPLTIYRDIQTHIVFGTCATDGTPGATPSTYIDVVFSGYDGIDLLASDFTFTDNDDSSKNISADSVISAAAGHYRIAISGDWADEDTVEIIINKVGFVCSDPGTVTLNNV